MKKSVSILLILFTVLLCACDDNTEISSTEPTAATVEASENISEDNNVQLSGGLNYSYSETEPLEYNGDEITMNIKLNISNSTATDMGVYLNVQGLFCRLLCGNIPMTALQMQYPMKAK